MMAETRKILARQRSALGATCARVPVFTATLQSVNLQTVEELSSSNARVAGPGTRRRWWSTIQRRALPAWRSWPRVSDDVLVGRIRRDPGTTRLNIWMVGATCARARRLNAVQLAELLTNADCSATEDRDWTSASAKPCSSLGGCLPSSRRSRA